MSSSPTSSSSGRRRRLPLHQQQQRPLTATTKRASPATSRETSPTGRTASPIGSRGGSSSPTGRRSPTTGRSTYASSLTSSTSSSPTHNSSFSSLSASRQRQYLDERKRQRVLQHLGGDNDVDDQKALSSSSNPYQAQQQDPLLIAPSATTSTMSPRFFLTPPERLQVNQSVNLMDVETGQYEFRTSDTSGSRKSFGELPKRKSSAQGSSLLSSIFGGSKTKTSPQNSFSGFSSFFGRKQQPEVDSTGGSSHEHNPRASFTQPQQGQDSSSSPTIETFHDEEVGLSKDASERSNTKKRSSKKNGKKAASRTSSTGNKNKDGSSVNFPTNFNPNDWEQKVKDSKQQAQDEETVKASTSGNKTKSKSKRKKLKRKLKNKLKKIKPGRLALVFFVLTMFGMALLLLIMATTDAAWSWFHPEEEKARSVNQDSSANSGPSIPPPHLIERNHSFLELGELPTSTQLLLTTGTSVFHETAQHEALLWIEEDPHVTIVGMNSNDTGTHSTMETLSARQRFALATLHYSSTTPLELPSDPAGWMDYHLNECDWFGVHRNYTVCNRYHQLHALPLRHANFQGTLPVEELSLLSNLRRVDLGYNQIQGILPPTLFSQWKNLEYLGLEHNALTGPLPSAIGLLTNSNGLDTLQLSYNQFSGRLPSEIGVLIPHLRHLNVMHNRLSGTIPTELGGFGNAANGTFGGYGTDYAALEELSLNGNFFTGKIPSELGRLTQLTKLALHHNLDLEAHQILPKEICQLPLLEVITVDCDIVKCPTSVPCPCSCVGQHAAATSSVFTLNHDGTASKATTMAPVVQQQERKHSNEIHGSSAAISLQQRSGGGGSTTTDSKEGETFQGAVGVVKRSQQNVFDQEHNPYKDNPFAKQKKKAPKTFTLDTKKTHHQQQQQGDSQNVFDQSTRRGLLRASFTL